MAAGKSIYYYDLSDINVPVAKRDLATYWMKRHDNMHNNSYTLSMSTNYCRFIVEHILQ